MNNTILLLDQGPRIPGYGEREPSIRQLIHKYYEGHLGTSEANRLAKQYIELSLAPAVKQTFALGVARRKWESLMEDGYRMTKLTFERSLNGVEQKGTIDPWGKVMWKLPLPPCGCQEGTCETRPDYSCRMVKEVAEAKLLPKNPVPADWLEDREFINAMYEYRMVPLQFTTEVTTALEAVKTLIRKRTERCIPSHELEGLPAPLPMPELKHAMYETKQGVKLYDQFYVHSYAVAYADASMRAALGIKAPIATPVTCPWDSWQSNRTIA